MKQNYQPKKSQEYRSIKPRFEVPSSTGIGFRVFKKDSKRSKTLCEKVGNK